MIKITRISFKSCIIPLNKFNKNLKLFSSSNSTRLLSRTSLPWTSQFFPNKKISMDRITKLASIDTWTKHFVIKHLNKISDDPEYNEHLFSFKPELNEKVSLWKGDITTLEVDAIVNAANKTLEGGGGVDGVIHHHAGRALLDECKGLNGCEIGEAKITKGYKLPAKHIIHTVGPRYDKDDNSLLKNCYENCLKVMLDNNLRSIAFPCISTGIYRYPNEEAAHIALKTARDFLNRPENFEKVDRIIFCLFDSKDVDIYEENAQKYFPVN